MHDTGTILMSLIFILLQLLLFIFNYQVFNKRIFQPAVLFALVWFGIILLHFIFSFTILDELFSLSLPTYVLFLVGTVCFTVGSFLVTGTEQSREVSSQAPKGIQEIKVSFLLRLILLAIITIGLPFYIQATYRIFIASQIDDFFSGVRTAITYYEEDVGPTKYLLSFSFVVFAINLYCFFQKRSLVNRVILITCLLVCIVYAVLATGRTFFLMILGVYMGISYLMNKKFSIKKYALLAVGFLLFFMAIGIVVGKTGDKESSTKENLQTTAEITATYLVLSLNAEDYEINHPLQINYRGDYTLRFFIKIGQQFNLVPDRKVTSLLQEFQFLPYPTNVYTIYSPYIKDFGKIYGWIMVLLFGALHTWVHNKAIRNKTLRFALYFSFLLYPLIMSFFQDQYMSLFSTWVQLVFYVEIFFFANKIFVSNKW